MIEAIRIAARATRWLPGLLLGGPASRRTTADVIERCAARQPEDVFVRFEDRTLTYGAWNEAANRVAHWALERRIGRGDVVALVMENRPEFLIVWAGIAKTGATTALLGPQLRGRALFHALDAASAGCVMLGSECAEIWASLEGERPGDLDVFTLDDPGASSAAPLPPDAKSLDEAVAGYSGANPPRRVRAALRGGDPLFYLYTSGTTGLPKAARFSHARFLGGGLFALLAGFSRRDTLYCALPLHHTVGGVMCVNAVLRTGATLALRRRFSARAFWRDVVEMEATAFQYIGEMCRYLLAQPVRDDERCHRVRLCIGNGLRPDIWDEFQRRFGIDRIVEFYGATESNVSLVNLAGRPGAVGRPAPGTRVALVRYDVERESHLRDAAGHCLPCADGEPGELLGRIREGWTAAGRFEGYTSSAASQEKVLRDVFASGDAWFRTGDLLRRDADGCYAFVDRIGDTFRWKGENVSTQEVAEALMTADEVGLCAVYGVKIPGTDGRVGMAALVPTAGHELDGVKLYERVASALPAHARPAFLRVQEAPDLTGTFKLRKVDLQRQGFDPDACSDPLFYRDDAARRYQTLDAAGHARIVTGDVRF